MIYLSYRKIVLPLGNFNIDLLNNQSKYFNDTTLSVGLHPLIVRPTRITTHSATVSDSLFTSGLNLEIVVSL